MAALVRRWLRPSHVVRQPSEAAASSVECDRTARMWRQGPHPHPLPLAPIGARERELRRADGPCRLRVPGVGEGADRPSAAPVCPRPRRSRGRGRDPRALASGRVRAASRYRGVCDAARPSPPPSPHLRVGARERELRRADGPCRLRVPGVGEGADRPSAAPVCPRPRRSRGRGRDPRALASGRVRAASRYRGVCDAARPSPPPSPTCASRARERELRRADGPCRLRVPRAGEGAAAGRRTLPLARPARGRVSRSAVRGAGLPSPAAQPWEREGPASPREREGEGREQVSRRL